MTLAQRIKHARQAKGLTQEQLALACGWESQSRIGNYEQGKREPTLADLRAIARALKPHATYASLVLDDDELPNTSQTPRLDVDTVREVAEEVQEGLRDAHQSPQLKLDLTKADHAAFFVDGYMTAMKLEQQGRHSKAARVLEISRRIHAQGARFDGPRHETGDQGESRSKGAGGDRRKAASSRRAAK